MRTFVVASLAVAFATAALAKGPEDDALRARAIAACVADETRDRQDPNRVAVGDPAATCGCSVDLYVESNGQDSLAALAAGADKHLLDRERQQCRRSTIVAPAAAQQPQAALTPLHPSEKPLDSPPPQGWATDLERSLPRLLGAGFVFIAGLTTLLRLRRRGRRDLIAPPLSMRPKDPAAPHDPPS